MKLCKKCSLEKPIAEFYKDKHAKTGVAAYCKECVKAKSSDWYLNNKARASESASKYRLSNPEKGIARAREWTEENRDRSREIKAAWKKRNPETVNRHAREGARRNADSIAVRKREYRSNNREKINAYQRSVRAKNITQRLSLAIGNSMREALRLRKAGRKWSEIAGYDVGQLVARLESLFADGMTWDNYGEWHIDHIRPVASFDFSKPGDIQACWALTNLQPLWALDNIRKGAKWELAS